jgi:hypothetical protein
MNTTEFANKVFDLFENDKKDDALELIKTVMNEAIIANTFQEVDLKSIIRYEIGKLSAGEADEIEKAAHDVFNKVKNTEDWQMLSTVYLEKKGFSYEKIEKVNKIL